VGWANWLKKKRRLIPKKNQNGSRGEPEKTGRKSKLYKAPKGKKKELVSWGKTSR